MRTVGNVPPALVATLAFAEAHRTMEQVVRGIAPRGGDIVDIVVQDEFTHDVVVGLDGVYLVYDST